MTLSNKLIQVILNYLSSKPYREVGQLIGAIQSELSSQSSSPKQESLFVEEDTNKEKED